MSTRRSTTSLPSRYVLAFVVSLRTSDVNSVQEMPLPYMCASFRTDVGTHGVVHSQDKQYPTASRRKWRDQHTR